MVIEESPQFLRRGEAGIVRLTPREPLYLETHISDGHLGRIVNYENMYHIYSFSPPAPRTHRTHTHAHALTTHTT